jgi:Holliday junction resolvase RusA-like endonuclease
VVSHANPHEKLWKKAVERAAFAAVIYRGDPVPLFRGPVSVRMVFTFEPPKGERARIGTPHTQKPDKDNLEKLVLDAMTRAGVFKDDSQGADGEVTKLWGERAGVVVLTEQIDGQLTQPPRRSIARAARLADGQPGFEPGSSKNPAAPLR